METGKAPIFIAASLAGVSTLHQVGKAYPGDIESQDETFTYYFP